MTEEVSSKEQANKEATSKRRRGVFPRITLNKALELVGAIYEEGMGEPVKRVAVFVKLGKSSESSLSRMLVTVANSGYGLVIGGYQADRLSLSERGKRIANPESEIDKKEAIFEALCDNEIFSSFVTYWADKPFPKDEIAFDWLVRNQNLNQSDAAAAWDVFKNNILTYDFTQKFSDKMVILSRDEALDNLKKNLPEKIVEKEKVDMQSTTGIVGGVLSDREKNMPLGVQVSDINLDFGRARVILPDKMSEDDVRRAKLQIDVMARIVKKDDESRTQVVEGK